jgi:hypothetical protein
MSTDDQATREELPRSRIALGVFFLGAALLQVVRGDIFMKLVPSRRLVSRHG